MMKPNQTLPTEKTYQPVLHLSSSTKYVNLAANSFIYFIRSWILVINVAAAASG